MQVFEYFSFSGEPWCFHVSPCKRWCTSTLYTVTGGTMTCNLYTYTRILVYRTEKVVSTVYLYNISPQLSEAVSLVLTWTYKGILSPKMNLQYIKVSSILRWTYVKVSSVLIGTYIKVSSVLRGTYIKVLWRPQ